MSVRLAIALALVVAATWSAGCSALGLSKFDIGTCGDCMALNNRDAIDVETACDLWQCRVDTCVFLPRDIDGDGVGAAFCGVGGDCADTDPQRSSLHPETCGGVDGNTDEDCDLVIDENLLLASGGPSLPLAGPRVWFARAQTGSGGPATAFSYDPAGATDLVLTHLNGSDPIAISGTAGLAQVSLPRSLPDPGMGDLVFTGVADATCSAGALVVGTVNLEAGPGTAALSATVAADASGCTSVAGFVGASTPALSLSMTPEAAGVTGGLVGFAVAPASVRGCGARTPVPVAITSDPMLGSGGMPPMFSAPAIVGTTEGSGPPAIELLRITGGPSERLLAFSTADGIWLALLDVDTRPQSIMTVPDIVAETVALAVREVADPVFDVALAITRGCGVATDVELVLLRVDVSLRTGTFVGRARLGTGFAPSIVSSGQLVDAAFPGAAVYGTRGWLVAYQTEDGPRLVRVSDAAVAPVDDSPFELAPSGSEAVVFADPNAEGGVRIASFDPVSMTATVADARCATGP